MAPIDLGSPDLTNVILRTALPAVGGLSINAVHQAVDAFFVGQLGPEALAAVSLILPLAGVPAAVGIGLGVGTATSIGRKLGADQPEQAGRVASAAMGACLLVAILLSLVIWYNQHSMIGLLGAQGNVEAPALAYLNLLAFSAGLGMVQILCDFVAIGEGNARFSLITLVVCFSLNMVLDPILIFWAGLGVQGAALATVLAQMITLGIYALYFMRRWGRIRLYPSFDAAALVRLGPVLKIGLPEAIAVLLASVSFVLIYRSAGALEGTNGQAAMGLSLRLWMLASLPLQGFCLGAQPVLAHAAGALNFARLHRATLIIAAIATGSGILFMAIGLTFNHGLGRLFTPEGQSLDLAMPAIFALSLCLPAVALRQSVLVMLQATARARSAAFLSLVPLGLLYVPLLIPMGPGWGFGELILYLPSAYIVAGIAAALILWRMPQLKLKGSVA